MGICKNILAYFRQKSGIEWTDAILDMFIKEPVENWGNILDSADFPPLRTTLACFLVTTLTLFYPPEIVDRIVLAALFLIPKSVLNYFTPKIYYIILFNMLIVIESLVV